MEEIEVADEVVAGLAEDESGRFEICDARVDLFRDAAAARFIHHPFEARARAIDRFDAPAAFGEPDRVTTGSARQIQGEPRCDAYDRRRERRGRRSEERRVGKEGRSGWGA